MLQVEANCDLKIAALKAAGTQNFMKSYYLAPFKFLALQCREHPPVAPGISACLYQFAISVKTRKKGYRVLDESVISAKLGYHGKAANKFGSLEAVRASFLFKNLESSAGYPSIESRLVRIFTFFKQIFDKICRLSRAITIT
jgi:hypothetical protein